MDVVYMNKNGENPELRYSLRTLQHVNHDAVRIFGGAPSWIDSIQVDFRQRMQRATPYRSTRSHIAAACNTADVSDPFMLWNDDFYAMKPVGDMPIYHRGPLDVMLVKFAKMKTPWGKGLYETASMLNRRGLLDGALSYDLHLPLIVYKNEMRETLRWAEKARNDAIHLRTLYGNLAGLGGVDHPDPKMLRKSDPFPRGSWLSSGDDTFRSSVEPVLRYLFPDPSPYEKG